MRKHFQKGLFILLAGCLSTLFHSSCSKPEKPKQTSHLSLNIQGDPATLDPRKGSDLTSSTLQFLLFEGLTRMTPYSTVSPAFAAHISVSPDQTKYVFQLREDGKWSNGDDITAYDFAQTWLDMLNPKFKAPNAHLLFPIKNAELAKRGLISLREVGIRAVDHRTLEVYLESPTPYFLELISFCTFFPISQRVAAMNEYWSELDGDLFISNGPYKLESWQKGHEIVLKKNPFYWDRANVDLEEIRISFVDNEMTALKMYDMDELDILGLPFTGIPSDSVPSLMDKGVIKTSSLPGSTICCFNLSEFPFTNANIRKAFAYAINRKEIVDNVVHQMGEPGTDLIPSILLPDQPKPFFQDGDAEIARFYLKKGLKELGISKKELGSITLLHASTGVYPKVAQALQHQWRKVLGVTVQLNGFEYKVFLDKLTHRDYQMSQCVWIAQYFDPTNFFDRFKIKDSLKNYPGYENEEYVQLINQSLLQPTKNERFELLRKAQEILMEDMPMTAIYHWKNIYLQKPHVKNLLTYPSGSFHLPNVFIEDPPEKKKSAEVS